MSKQPLKPHYLISQLYKPTLIHARTAVLPGVHTTGENHCMILASYKSGLLYFLQHTLLCPLDRILPGFEVMLPSHTAS